MTTLKRQMISLCDCIPYVRYSRIILFLLHFDLNLISINLILNCIRLLFATKLTRLICNTYVNIYYYHLFSSTSFFLCHVFNLSLYVLPV